MGPTKIVVLGSTGSIGRSTIEVVQANCDAFDVIAISAHSNLCEALDQARRLKPRWLVATDSDAAERFDWRGLPNQTEVLIGQDHVEMVAGHADADVVVAAIVGSAGLRGTWAAVKSGKRVALANKETLVVAGPLVMDLAKRCAATIVPVDSEHNAIFQAISAGNRDDVARIILTASGGPFRRWTEEQMANVSLEDALNHPVWSMGPKITIDSATMMNKALEIIEARWLFGIPGDQIEVVVHPQSIIHSFVEFKDGSIIAQMSPPDMRLPIQYALTYPDRLECPTNKMDWDRAFHLEFEPPDKKRFPALELGHEVASVGGTAGAVLNAANEAAVEQFLEGQLPFHEIVPACRSILEQHEFESQPSLDRLLELDSWAREEVSKWICA